MSKYSISIVTFIDILGFGQIVKTTSKPNEVASILNALRHASAIDKEDAKLYDKKFVNFSDTAIRTTNILSKANRQHRIGILMNDNNNYRPATIIIVVHQAMLEKRLEGAGVLIIGKRWDRL